MKKRLLFLYVGPFFYPHEVPTTEKYRLLSERYRGDILAVLNDRSFNSATLGDFVLRGLYLPLAIRRIRFLRNGLYGIFAITKAVFLNYSGDPYDAIIAPEPIVAGILALVIRLLTGAKAIVEVNGQFEAAFRFGGEQIGWKDRLKEKYVRLVLPFVLRRADGVRLLYREQLRAFFAAPLDNAVSFADFVPIRRFREGSGSPSNYILFIGYPWYLKGVDLLIQAFNLLAEEFPHWSLRIVGYCPDKAPFVELARGNPRIVLSDPVKYEEVIELTAGCSIFVLPSRTEAMGRVLLEAMASRKPVVASNVDGIPTIVKHGETGLLFESGNVSDLAAKLKTIMADAGYGRQLADRGFDFVHAGFMEDHYLERFSSLVQQVSSGFGRRS